MCVVCVWMFRSVNMGESVTIKDTEIRDQVNHLKKLHKYILKTRIRSRHRTQSQLRNSIITSPCHVKCIRWQKTLDQLGAVWNRHDFARHLVSWVLAIDDTRFVSIRSWGTYRNILPWFREFHTRRGLLNLFGVWCWERKTWWRCTVEWQNFFDIKTMVV